jgi:hypothetical protein
MKRLFFASIILSVCVASLDAQSLNWRPTNGPFSGSINCYAANMNYVFAGTSDSEGLYRSSDNGVTWSWIGNGLIMSGVTTLAANGASIFAGYAGYNGYGTGYGIFHSTDSGNTWSHLTNLTKANIIALATNATACFAATDMGFFRSTDNGNSWDTILPLSGVQCIAIQDSIMVVGESGGVAISLNNGNTWHSSMIGYYFQPLSVSSVAIEKSTLFASTDSGMFRSTNLGEYWEKISPVTFACFAGIDSTIIVGDIEGMAVSTDLGLTWNNAGFQSDTDYWNVTALFVKDTILFAGIQDLGNYYSSDRGRNWIQATTGMANTYVQAVFAVGNIIYAGTNTADVSVGGYSPDKGITWHEPSGGLTGAASFGIIDSEFFTATGYGIYVSLDSGYSWNEVCNNSPAVAEVIADGNILIANDPEGFLYRSTDSGQSWNTINNGIPVDLISVCGSAIYTSYAGSANDYISMDSGVTWSQVNDALDRYIYAQAANNNTIFVATETGVEKSTNDGTSWTQTSVRDTAFAIYAAGNIVLATTVSGIFLSTNNGAIWSKQSDGLKYASCYSIAGNFIFAGTYGEGVYMTPFTAAAVTSQPIPVQTFTVFPNPLTTSATFSYSLANQSSVTISIFDALGREVARPLSGVEQDAGANEIPIDSRNLLPGVYTCRLSANDKEQTVKVVVNR